KATTVRDLKDDILVRTSEVDVYGTVYSAREAIFRMAKSNGGTGGVIINGSSIAARPSSPGEYVYYAASRAAVETFTNGSSKEMGRDGIRVNAPQSGTTDTDLHQRSGNPERLAMVASTAPLGRVATPRDIVEVILWLASPEVGYTNAVLPIAGGL
ncbi:MAG: SDR family oxidoreductase, partial [Pseudomonadota bacterium]|nr:SDR family oxidoreductase [Pseudomonadota bacterium]